MRFTVFGATGGTGRQLVQQALDAGHEVTAVVRDPARLPVRNEGPVRLEVVTAEVTDPEALVPAVAGRDAVLSALGAPSNKAAGIASRGTRAILRAMEEGGARRYIGVSAAPVVSWDEGESLLVRRVMVPLLRRALRQVYADLAVMEDAVRASGLEWTVVRPPKLTDKPASGTYQRVIGGNVPRSHSVSRADLAAAILAMVEDPATVGQGVGVAS
ncbi:epimerase [Streptomyces abyssalis]|uniref:Epimerase n=1 Tax=Streptomyces abyssalis TaxID=933944 RepID=A0A1E7JFH1_9ACTN|nr:SDR family oxidoreductase [Streptomyces abyssalis]OEU85214.1 epimerase [Streptomyces abyssalis]OEU95635.1 epimerase [Streptomyces abyssalis]OEV29814.1 epimerase [Streptomyces nanshensis]